MMLWTALFALKVILKSRSREGERGKKIVFVESCQLPDSVWGRELCHLKKLVLLPIFEVIFFFFRQKTQIMCLISA